MKERKLRLTLEKCNEFAKQYGFTVLDLYNSEENKTMVKVECENKHIHDLQWATFRAKHGCTECNRKYPPDYIQEYASKYGYKVKNFDNFNDLNSSLCFICPNGHILASTFSNFMRNRRCPCDGGVESYSQEKVEFIFEEQGCKLLSQYTKQKDKVDFQCSCGNVAQIRVDHFLKGVRCNECAKIKRRKTMYKNGTAPCSRQQRYLHNLYGGELNYPIDKCSLDIAFPEEKIYVEYNGSGHDLQVKFNVISEAEFEQIENNRFLFLKIEGYKCIYLCSQKDLLPSDDVLINILNLGKDILLSNYNLFYVVLDIDNKKVITSKFTKDYNFGNLRKITKKDI